MKNKGISLILLVLIITILLGITTITIVLITNNSTTGLEQEENFKTSQEDNIFQEEQTEEISSDFISKYKTWPTTITDSKLNMFSSRITTPIDLRQFSSFISDKIYFSSSGYYNDEKVDNDSIKNIEDFLNVSATIKNNSAREFFLYEGDSPYSISGYVVNCSEKDLTIKECFDNNWWFIEESSAHADTLLGIDMSDSTDLYNSDYDSLLIDRFILKCGGPSRIGKVADNYYMLYFTFNEFTIQINCSNLGNIYKIIYYPNEILTYMQQSDIEGVHLTEDTFFLK